MPTNDRTIRVAVLGVGSLGKEHARLYAELAASQKVEFTGIYDVSAETARRIAAAPAADHGLHERIALRGPDDEVKDLADTFDTMVERLDRSFDGQRRFVANASHELRTPLTLGRALVELAMHRKAAPAGMEKPVEVSSGDVTVDFTMEVK